MSRRTGYLLDTNPLGAAVAKDSAVRHRLIAGRRGGARFGTCVPVLCEQEAGAQQVRGAVASGARRQCPCLTAS